MHALSVKSDAKRPLIVKRGIQEVVEKVKPDEIDEIDEASRLVNNSEDIDLVTVQTTGQTGSHS